MKLYRNRFERIYKVHPYRGFYSDMARFLNTHFATIHNNFWNGAKPSSERIFKIIMFVDQKLGVIIQPEIFWNEDISVPTNNEYQFDYECFRKDVMGWMKDNRIKEHCDIIEKYLDGETYESIGYKFGKTRERIRSIIKRDVEFLREYLNLEDYRVQS